jgi:uncharacterized membrane protein
MSEPTRPTILERLRNWFLTGLLVLGPLVVTGYVVWKLFGFVDHLLGTTLRGGYIRPGGVPGIGFLTVLLIILVTGLLASNLLGRSLGRVVERVLLRVPYLRGLYSTLRELGEAILSEKRNAFQRVVLVEYPTPGIYAIGFLTAEPRRFSDPGRKPLAAVFIPTVPNPTTGLVLFYPEEALIPTSVTVEQAIKMVISGGVVTPERISSRKPGGPRDAPAAGAPASGDAPGA